MNNNSPTFDPKFEPDPLAIKESQALSAFDDLEKEAATADHHRFQKFKNAVNKIAIVLLYIFAILLVIAVITIAWHLMAPEYCHYLSAGQLDKLHTIVGSALFSSIATNYIKNRVQ